MKRAWNEIWQQNAENGYAPGDDTAHRAAAVLGDRHDAPTLESLTDALAMLERVGGQLCITAARVKLSDEGELVDDDASGEYTTIGLDFTYETRDARLQLIEPPEEVQVAWERETEEPDNEYSLRDEIEAEVGSEPDSEVFDQEAERVEA